MIIVNIVIDLLILMYFLLKNKGSSVLNRHTILRFLIFVVFGIGATVVSLLFENFFTTLVSMCFAGSVSYVDGVLVWYNKFLEISYYFVMCFFVIGILEELAKILPTYFYSEHFLFGNTYLKKFDFLIPFLVVGLTFSLIENGLYFKNSTSNLIYLRMLTQFSGHILFALLTGEAYYKYSVKSYCNRISYTLRNKNVPNIKSISGMRYNRIFKVGCIIVMLLHGVYDFLLYVFPNIGYIFIAVSSIYFIVYMIKLKNSKFKEDTVNRFLKDNSHLTLDEVYLLLEEE